MGTLGMDTAGELEIFKAHGPGMLLDIEKKVPKFETNTGKIWEGERSLTRVEYPGANSVVDAIEAFNKCIEENTEFISSGVDGLRERELQWAVMESSRTGKAVNVPISHF